jgi:hypothetical protein
MRSRQSIARDPAVTHGIMPLSDDSALLWAEVENGTTSEEAGRALVAAIAEGELDNPFVVTSHPSLPRETSCGMNTGKL